MASVDSGVDTGNDSNDSFAQDKNSFSQNETQSSSVASQTLSSVGDSCASHAHSCSQSHCIKGRLVCFESVDTSELLHYMRIQRRNRCYEIHFEGLSSAYRNYNLINKLKLRKKIRVERSSWLKKPILTKVCNENCLRLAACVNDVSEVKRYLDLGVDPNCADNHFRTPLHMSACNGDVKTVKSGIQAENMSRSWEGNICNLNGGQRVNVQLLSLLLDHGANPNLKDLIGNTPLHLAVCTSHIDVVTLLLKAGTDASSYNVIGRSPLQLAKSKLRIIQRSQDHNYKLQVTSQVVEMLVAFIKKKTEVTKNSVDEELLNAFQSRLQISETQEQVENELQNLLDNLSSLSLSNSSSTPSTLSSSMPSTSTAAEANAGST